MAARRAPLASIRGVFAGAGSDGLNQPAVVDRILDLVKPRSAGAGAPPPADVTVAYLGTATFDLPAPRTRQTTHFAARGCRVLNVAVALDATAEAAAAEAAADASVLGAAVLPSAAAHARWARRVQWLADATAPKTAASAANPAAAAAAAGCTPLDGPAAVAAVEAADIVIVSGGNTLFAVDRWRRLGLDAALLAAAGRGAVLCGGSAGAICWFEGGHSDSADPDTYCDPMLRGAAQAAVKEAFGPAGAAAAAAADESSAAPQAGVAAKEWGYIRASCLGALPGLVCPHFDKIQSNGVPRFDDFDGMVRRHPAERCLTIDHWAALVLDGTGHLEVLSLAGLEGSLLLPPAASGSTGEALGEFTGLQFESGYHSAFSPDRKGAPWCWAKRVGADGKIEMAPLPARAPAAAWICEGTVQLDAREERCFRDQMASL